MKFWACEVKTGESFKVQPGKGMVVHLSQANVGEFEKGGGNQSVFLLVNVDGKELVLGSLSSKKLPQQQFDLLFDRDFELSHDWKCGSVYFFGYRAKNPVEEYRDTTSEDGSSEEEESTSDDSPFVDYMYDKEDKPPRFLDGHVTSESSEDEDESDSEEDTPASVHYKNHKLSTEDEDDSKEDTPVKVVPGKTCQSKLETSVVPGKTCQSKVKAKTLQKTDGNKGGVASPKDVQETSCRDRKHKRCKQ